MHKRILLTALSAFVAFSFSPVHAQAVPAVGVRAGAHEKFDRLVFDWPHSVKYEIRREGARASIIFEANAHLTPPSRSDLTRAKDFAVSKDEKGHVVVSFLIDPNASFNSFTNATSVVVDIQGKAAKGAGVAAEPAPEKKAKESSFVAASPKPTARSAEMAKTPPSQTTPSPEPEKPKKEAANAVSLSFPLPAAAPAEAVPPDAPLQIAAPPVFDAPPDASATSSAPPPEPLKEQQKMEALSDTPALVASFDPHVPVRAVIFRRANVAYVVFDRKFGLSLSDLQNGLPSKVDLTPFDLPKNSAYRFSLPSDAELYATLDGTAWKIFVSKKRSTLPVSTTLVAQPDFALGARLLLPLPDAPEPIRFLDPIVGDDLIFVPLAQSQAFNVERNFADLAILPAAQGLVIKPLRDKLIVRAVSDGIEITTETGLLLSRPADTGATLQSAGKMKAAAAGKSIFDFATWKGKPGEAFTQTRQRLQQIIVDVTEAERNRARLELARFYFANGLGEEALSLLQYIASQVPDLRAHADFMALLGAAEILAYRSEDGIRDLSIPALSGQPEADLWIGVGMAQMRDWQNAEVKFAQRKSILTGYPEPFYSHFFVLAIESALAVGKDREAAEWLVYVSGTDHSPLIEPALAFLRGAVEAKAGHAIAAGEAWKEAAASNDRLYKVRAELALIDLGVSSGSLTAAQAADRLEALRFGWRGDDLEVDILRRLGQFYVQAQNVKAGLNAMSQAVMLYPASPLTPSIRAEMANSFHDIFLGDLGKKFSPLEALTLYQQYRSLMPSGKDGDDILNNLAERLVAVDLLDQAASILEDMARTRLQGADKARAALRLSAIRLLDHKPDQALAALDLIGNDSLSADFQNERLLLRARSLSELNRNPEALTLLKDNTSQGARMLCAEIALHDQKWDEATKNLMDLVGPPPMAGKALTPDQATWLVKAAIAYALSDDQPNLDRLAIDYGEAMSQTPQKDAFLVLTKPAKTGQLRDLASAQAQLSQTDMFMNFLNAYRGAGKRRP